MNITRKSLAHWNYFLSLESDLVTITRYIEIDPMNFRTFSVELAKLFLASTSEVDVVLKLLCKCLKSNLNPRSIGQYRKIITEKMPQLIEEPVRIPRYSIEFDPWKKWRVEKSKNPDWWKNYNYVKHHRDKYFAEANLENVLKSLSGLFVVVSFYYKCLFDSKRESPMSMRGLFVNLEPSTVLFRLKPEYYSFIHFG